MNTCPRRRIQFYARLPCLGVASRKLALSALSVSGVPARLVAQRTRPYQPLRVVGARGKRSADLGPVPTASAEAAPGATHVGQRLIACGLPSARPGQGRFVDVSARATKNSALRLL